MLALVLGGAYSRHLEVVKAGESSLIERTLVSPAEVAAARQQLVAGAAEPQVQLHVPWWVIVLCATTMGIGTSVGGWRIIRTMELRLVKLEPHHGFAAETGAATAIQLASIFGIPLSTTHTISTAIMGVGATRRLSAVRWGVAREIVAAWILTFPICAAIAFLAYWLLEAVT